MIFTIFSWEIANELEYWRFSEKEVKRWVSEIANYIKTIDKNHLVSIGLSSNSFNFADAGYLQRTFNVPELDFISFHFYPPSDTIDPQKMIVRQQDLRQIGLATKMISSLGKPAVMGEFGFSNSQELNSKMRSDPDGLSLYSRAFKEYMDAAFNAGASGVMFWGWGISEEKRVPMWWSSESHSTSDKSFCDFLKSYQIPNINK